MQSSETLGGMVPLLGVSRWADKNSQSGVKGNASSVKKRSNTEVKLELSDCRVSKKVSRGLSIVCFPAATRVSSSIGGL
jgi:hypothetical protein